MKLLIPSRKIRSAGIRIAVAMWALALVVAPAALAQKSLPEPAATVESDSAFSKWWNGTYLTGNWFGVRDTLEENGIKLTGKYSAGFFGVVDSERGSRGFYDQELVFAGEVNAGKLLRTEVLEGLHFETIGRWRDPSYEANPNNFVLATPLFNQAPWQGGFGWRLQSAAFEWNSRDLFPVKDMIQLRGGWLRPWSEFIIQPLTLLFMNNAIISAKGIGANIPFSTSVTTWGGSLRVKPTEWSYTKLGLYMASPEIANTNNRGLAFQGYGPDPSQNGLLTLVESGVTPKIGPSQLPGKYAVGGYYFGQAANSFFGTSHYGKYGFYWQADQMLFREPSPLAAESVPSGKETVEEKSFKTPVPPATTGLSEQGLSMFSLVTFAPKYNNPFPFYFQTGLAYKGLIPGRDADQMYFGMALGSYSYYNTVARRNAGNPYQPNCTMVLEGGYRVALTKFAYFSPFVEYLIRPNGTDDIRNALVLGTSFSVQF